MMVNRAAAVAEVLGFEHDEARPLGREKGSTFDVYGRKVIG